MDQRGRVANPARGRLHWENEIFPVPVWRPAPRQSTHSPHTQANFPRRRFFSLPPIAIGSIPSLSGNAIIIVYRWYLAPRIRRNKAICPQGINSSRVTTGAAAYSGVIPMDQLMYDFIFLDYTCIHRPGIWVGNLETFWHVGTRVRTPVTGIFPH